MLRNRVFDRRPPDRLGSRWEVERVGDPAGHLRALGTWTKAAHHQLRDRPAIALDRGTEASLGSRKEAWTNPSPLSGGLEAQLVTSPIPTLI